MALGIVLLGVDAGGAGAAEPDAFRRGLELFGQGQYPEAEAAFRDAVAADPESARAAYYLGLSQSKLDQTEQAAQSFEAALTLDPERAEAYLHLGIARYKLDRDDAAAKALDEAIARLPENATAVFFRGLTEQALGGWASSIDYFEKAMALDPDYAQLAYYNIGLAQDRLGQEARAKQAFSRAVELDSESATAEHARTFLERMAGTEKEERAWSVAAEAGIEYDDNVTRSDLDQVTAEGDVLARFALSGTYRLLRGPDLSLEASYKFSQSIYQSLTNFNLESHSGSLSAARDWGNATLGLDYRYTRSLLGGFDFLGDHNLRPSVRFPVTPAWYLSLSYNLESKNFIRGVDADRDALQNGASIDNFLFFNDNKSYVEIGYILASENADGQQFDYLAQTGKISLRTPLEVVVPVPGLDLRLDYRFRFRDYANVTNSIGSERLDRRHTVLLRLDYALTDYAGIEFNYRYIDSISNLPSVDYNKNVIGLSVQLSY